MKHRNISIFLSLMLSLSLLAGCTATDGNSSLSSNISSASGGIVGNEGSGYTSNPGSGYTSNSGSGYTSNPGSGYTSDPGSGYTSNPGSNNTSVVSTPSGFQTTGQFDLMKEAISLSGYAGSGLSSLQSSAIGAGTFGDYNKLHSSPLTSASYVLGVQQKAQAVKQGGTLAAFSTALLKQYGPQYNVSASYTVYTDLSKAFDALFQATGNTNSLNRAKAQIPKISSSAQAPLARWISAATYAYSLTAATLKSVTEADFQALCQFTFCTVTSSDVTQLQRMNNLSQAVSLEKLLKAGVVLLKATEELAAALSSGKAITTDNKQLIISTSAGSILLGSTGADRYDSPEALLICDPAGNDTYNGRIAASHSLKKSLAVVLDLAGNDTYENLSGNSTHTQGTGVLGAGILMDMGGKDSYTALRMAQGCAILGLGVLYDNNGDDSYYCNVTSQGSAFYGLALLADAAGNDKYTALAFSQASAGPRGLAYLLDIAGNDSYVVTSELVAGYEGLAYDQFPNVNGNWSQGCGWGQRYINYSGGIAGLLDLSGKDSYTGALWVQGTGYWSGVGFLFDQAGDDTYKSYYYSQASVAHYGVGILIDIGGNDKHTVFSGGKAGDGASLGFVWDRGTAMFVNEGGDDIYTTSATSGGVAMSAYDETGYQAQNMTYAFFFDIGGNDLYYGTNQCWGFGRGGYCLDTEGQDENMSMTKFNDHKLHGASLQGGVFINYDPSKKNPKAAYLGFWNEAKSAVGLK